MLCSFFQPRFPFDIPDKIESLKKKKRQKQEPKKIKTKFANEEISNEILII